MNRLQKEALRKYQDARKGLTPEQVRALDLQEAEDKAVAEFAARLHVEHFPEEYDSQYDDYADAADRRRGINPMRAEYIAEVNERRRKLGVSALSESGLPTSNDSRERCLREARRKAAELRTRIDEILFYKWDPLRVSDGRLMRDEYAGYVHDLLLLALTSAGYEPLADYLSEVRTVSMERSPRPKEDRRVAQLIFMIARDLDDYPDYSVIAFNGLELDPETGEWVSRE